MAGSPVCLACRGQVSRPSRLCPHRRGPRGLNATPACRLTRGVPAFARGATRGCAGHSAWWPSGIGPCASARSARTRHRTRPSPDRRSGCPRCIEPDAGNPVEVVPFAQPAQIWVFQVAVGDGRGAAVRGTRRAVRDIDLAQHTAACRRCLPAERPFSRRVHENSDTVRRRGPTPTAGSREGLRTLV